MRRLLLSVPSSLAAERIRSSYSGMLTDAIRDSTGVTVRVELLVETAPKEPRVDQRWRRHPSRWLVDDHDLDPMHGATAAGADDDKGDRTWASGTLNARYTFDQFVIGASNRFAHAAALSVAESPGRSYNPLFIYGPAGLGKTHLLHAIGHHVRTVFRNKRVRYVSTESFMNEFVDAIRAKAMPSFKRRYRDLDVLLIDDIQFLERTQELQEEFFHTFNQLHSEGGPDRHLVRPGARSRSPASRTASAPASSGASSPTSSRPSSRPASPSSARRPSRSTSGASRPRSWPSSPPTSATTSASSRAR